MLLDPDIDASPWSQIVGYWWIIDHSNNMNLQNPKLPVHLNRSWQALIVIGPIERSEYCSVN